MIPLGRAVQRWVSEECYANAGCFVGGRLGPEASVHAGNRLFVCAICHCSLEADTGISVHAGSFFSHISAGKAWQGPFLCANCKTRQDAKHDAEKKAKLHAEKDGNQGADKDVGKDSGKDAKLES